jgi:cytochrome P450
MNAVLRFVDAVNRGDMAGIEAAFHADFETSLAEGEKVLLGLASANRDEMVYHDPGAFRLDRDGEPPHVAFGWGTHTCIGAPVVRHAGATLLTTFLDLIAAIELEPGTTPRPYLSPQGNGLDELRVRLTAAGGTPARTTSR